MIFLLFSRAVVLGNPGYGVVYHMRGLGLKQLLMYTYYFLKQNDSHMMMRPEGVYDVHLLISSWVSRSKLFKF